jgi:hypothetical protein
MLATYLALAPLVSQAQVVDTNVYVMDGYASGVPGAVTLYESSTTSQSITANAWGWASGLSLPPGEVGVITLAEHRTRQGLLLGQTFVHSVSELPASGASAGEVCLFSQPLAISTHIESDDTHVFGSIGLDWEWDAFPIQDSPTKYAMTPEVAFLGDTRAIDATEAFWSASFPDEDYRVGIDLVLASDCDLGSNGVVFRINAAHKSFTSTPGAQGIIVTDYVDRATGVPPVIPDPFHSFVSVWDPVTQVCEVQVTGKMRKGHNLILLSPISRADHEPAIHIDGTPGLIASADTKGGELLAAAQSGVGESSPPAASALLAVATDAPTCPPVPEPDGSLWVCDLLDAPSEPESVPESGSCGGWQLDGLCYCGPDKNIPIMTEICGSGGDSESVSLQLRISVTVGGSLAYEWGPVTGSGTTTIGTTLAVTYTGSIVTNDGANGCGQCKQMYVSFMAKSCDWIRYYTKHKRVPVEPGACGAHPHQACNCNCYTWVQDGPDCSGSQTATTSKVHFKLITEFCDRADC